MNSLCDNTRIWNRFRKKFCNCLRWSFYWTMLLVRPARERHSLVHCIGFRLRANRLYSYYFKIDNCLGDFYRRMLNVMRALAGPTPNRSRNNFSSRSNDLVRSTTSTPIIASRCSGSESDNFHPRFHVIFLLGCSDHYRRRKRRIGRHRREGAVPMMIAVFS